MAKQNCQTIKFEIPRFLRKKNYFCEKLFKQIRYSKIRKKKLIFDVKIVTNFAICFCLFCKALLNQA